MRSAVWEKENKDRAGPGLRWDNVVVDYSTEGSRGTAGAAIISAASSLQEFNEYAVDRTSPKN